MTKRGAVRRKTNPVRSRQAMLQLLKQLGPTDAQALASKLGISAMAVRQHLYGLRNQALVTYQEQPRAVGRPAKMWSLTTAADRFFPDAHAGLTVNVLNAADQTFGQQGVQRVVSRCAQQQIENYRSRIPATGSLQSRLQALIFLRNEEGYMAEVQRQRDGSFLLIENHCPISAAANVCPKLCDAELEVFRTVLGEGMVIERMEHMVAGARRCVYRVQATAR
ncbi:MAG: transcriptional regulator [Verrucomicrobia bacterium]|nr:transcriptional regulator [Verrucomicrobiota bacterium]